MSDALTWPILLILFVVVLGLLIFSVNTLYAGLIGAPYVPTRRCVVADMIALARLTKNDTTLDVGSGDGRIVFAAAQKAGECIGVEINPFLVWWSRLVAYRRRTLNTSFVRCNFWRYSLDRTDVLFVYCIPGKMARLEEKIIREMKPCSRIISHAFHFPNLPLIEQRGKVSLYQKK